MISCTFCGRDNDGSSRFCMDCGKPITPSAAALSEPSGGPDARAGRREPVAPGARGVAVAPAPMSAANPSNAPTARCPSCRSQVDPALPFCAYCGSPTGFAPPPRRTTGGTAVFSARDMGPGPRLSLLNDAGEVAQTFALERGEAIVGRSDGDLQFPHDVYLSPMHAQISWRDGQLSIRDLGSRNGTWIFADGPHKLQDCDLMLVGSQLLRFRRLGYPGPHPPEADSTRRMGSLTPTADIAVLEQLRHDRSVRDVFHLSPGRSALLGRDHGDWLFPYDKTMSGKHCEVRSEDSDFYVHDAGSRNGIAIGIRGEWPLKKGNRVMLGDQILRVDQA